MSGEKADVFERQRENIGVKYFGLIKMQRVFDSAMKTGGSREKCCRGAFFCYFSCPSRKVKEKNPPSWPLAFWATIKCFWLELSIFGPELTVSKIKKIDIYSCFLTLKNLQDL